MSRQHHYHYFSTPHRCTVVALPFDLPAWLSQWSGLRRKMITRVPEQFTRDEWAYLTVFLDESNLWKPFLEAFGESSSDGKRPSVLARPRGLIGIWLPNNVSLLGPLTLILASLSGAPIRVKVGSNAADLTSTFLDFAIRHLPDGALAEYLRNSVRVEKFDRHDPRNAELAAAARVRVVFGSDEAVNAIHGLPHPPDSVAISFGNHRSEAWVEKEALTEERIKNLIRVFSIYGAAGCTSPRRVAVLNGSRQDAGEVQEALVEMWPEAVRVDVPMHLAAGNVMEHQMALSRGWRSLKARRNAGIVLAGGLELAEPAGLLSLPVVYGSVDELVASVPPNIQTIGHCIRNPHDPRWLEVITRTPVKRFVPVEAMHHFGAVWDGSSYWRGFFEEMEFQG